MRAIRFLEGGRLGSRTAGRCVAISMFRRCLISALGAVVILLPVSADAALSGWRTRTVESANGNYVLVLLAPDDGSVYESTTEALTEDEIRARQRVREIEERYSQSGLYPNDGSTEALWPINYISVSKSVFVADDGIHLVVAFVGWDIPNVSDRGNALEFYARGQQLSTYNEDKLLLGYYGRFLLSRFNVSAWPTCTSTRLDDTAGTFEITTNWGDMFRFDITTGALITSRTARAIKAVLVSIAMLIALAGWWVWRRIVRVRGAAYRH
jgi:hypothetical protein